MPKILLLLLATLAALGAGDPWAKVRQLKSGDELRIGAAKFKRTPGGVSVESTEFKTVYRRPPGQEKKP